MTGGERLYLILVIAAFAVFSAVLAYQTWKYGEGGPLAAPGHDNGAG